MYVAFLSLLERRPSTGILASLTGFGTSLLAYFQMVSMFLGLVGAAFGCVAGYYTWRIKRHQWLQISEGKNEK